MNILNYAKSIILKSNGIVHNVKMIVLNDTDIWPKDENFISVDKKILTLNESHFSDSFNVLTLKNNNWIIENNYDKFDFNPISGTGLTLVNVSLLEFNTGRSEKNTDIAISISSKNSTSIRIKEEAKEEFITIDKSEYNINENSNTIKISGKSNSKILNIQVEADFDIKIPTNFTVLNNITSIFGDFIPGDPGLTNEFNFNFNITIPENTTVKDRNTNIKILCENENVYKNVVINQSAIESYIYINESGVSELNIDFNKKAEPISVNILSNTSCIIEDTNWEDGTSDRILIEPLEFTNNTSIIINSDMNKEINSRTKIVNIKDSITNEIKAKLIINQSTQGIGEMIIEDTFAIPTLN